MLPVSIIEIGTAIMIVAAIIIAIIRDRRR